MGVVIWVGACIIIENIWVLTTVVIQRQKDIKLEVEIWKVKGGNSRASSLTPWLFSISFFCHQIFFSLPLSRWGGDPWCRHPPYRWPQNRAPPSSPIPANDRWWDGWRRKRWIEPASICCEHGSEQWISEGKAIRFVHLCGGSPYLGGGTVRGWAQNVIRARFTSTARCKTNPLQIHRLSVFAS